MLERGESGMQAVENGCNARNIDLANYYARMSCPKWNRAEGGLSKKILGVFYKHSRRRFRKKYRQMIIPSQGVNTYPWPFCAPDFANWEEDDDPDNYSLVSDPSGCVVKYATSYCSWKIFEATGVWPQKKTKIRMDAKNWKQFLKEAGHGEIVAHPSVGGKYVGINPHIEPYGLVVWYEGDDAVAGQVVVSSYINKQFVLERVNFVDYDWIRIC